MDVLKGGLSNYEKNPAQEKYEQKKIVNKAEMREKFHASLT